MILYDFELSGNCYKIRLFLSILGLSWETRTVDFYPGGAWSTMRPHAIDNVLIDVDAGKVVAPPRDFGDFLATSYADDGRYALLFDKHGKVQRWRTLPWPLTTGPTSPCT